MRISTTTTENSIEMPQKLKIELLYDPVIPHLGINLKECKSGINKDTSTPMFIAALFTLAMLWKQPICPTSDEQIKKIWCIFTIQYYSAIKKNALL
jgi:hypothetical protein